MRKKRQSSQHCHFTLLGSASVKVVHIMLMKSTPGVDLTSILREAFMCADPKSAKNTVKLSVFFALLGSECLKAAGKNVGEIYLYKTFRHLTSFTSQSA